MVQTDKSSTNKDNHENPAKNASVFSLLFFCWLNDFVRKGCKKEPDVSDLYPVTDDKTASRLHDQIENEWKKELKKIDSGRKPRYNLALWRCFKWQFVITGFFTVVKDLSRMAQPLLLARVLRYFKDGDGVSGSESSAYEAYLYCLGLLLTAAAVPLIHQPLIFLNFVTGMKMKIASCTMLYRKALRLSHKSVACTTTGHIVNLMSNDVTRLEFAFVQSHYVWWGPLLAVLILVILWMQLGPTSLAGYALVLILTPIQGSLGRAYARLRARTAVQTDERIRLMDQVVAGMKVIKMYCWEKPFSQLISAVRLREMRVIAIASRIRLLSSELGSFSFSKIATAACILVHVLVYDRMLTLEKVVILMRLLVLVQDTLAYGFSKGIGYLSEANATCTRIQSFLLLEEVKLVDDLTVRQHEDPSVHLNEFSGKWEGGSGEMVLDQVTIQVKTGELMAVVGPVGCGKSSLLMALLGELPPCAGSVSTNGRVAYASQQPWIFSASVKDNIIFGADYDAEKYRSAIEACDLVKDIESFGNGDDTLVGERGVILSGGQRARIGLARAVYREADIYLLDDPLSAVDAAVARHLFDRCINGILKNRVRVLVTHQLHFVQAATRALVLVGGKVKAIGTYTELCNSGVDFVELLKRPDAPADDMQFATTSRDTPRDDDIAKRPATYCRLPRSFSASALEADFACWNPELLSAAKREYKSTSHLMDRNKLLLTPDDDLSASETDSSDSRDVELAHDVMEMNELSKDSLERNPLLCQADIDGDITTLTSNSIKPSKKAAFEQERTHKGSVSMGTYAMYFRLGGGPLSLTAVAILLAGGHASFMILDWYSAKWAYEEDAYTNALQISLMDNFSIASTPAFTNATEAGLNNASLGDILNRLDLDSTYKPEDRLRWTYIYSSLVGILVLASCARTVAFCQICLRASRRIHDQMFSALVRAPMRFFDTNPVGRVLNRFSKDTGIVDDQLPIHFLDFFTESMGVLGTVAMATIANPWVLLLLIPISMGLYVVQRLYMTTSRAVKRLEGITRSPVFSHVSATLTGLHTVRAYRAQAAFVKEFDNYQDGNTAAFYMHLCLARWLSIRLEMMCSAFISATLFACLIAKDNLDLNPSLFGLAANYLIALTGNFQFVVRHITTIENLMTSVERIAEYTKLDPEAPLVTDVRPPSGWPETGSLEAECMSMRYGSGEPLVLKDISFQINGSEKVGICGRTGAGKSSLLSALFRLCEPNGYLAIDGVRVTEIGLNDLRSKISIIPQDPVLFSTSVRGNLDPFGQHTDEALWDVLRQSQLAPAVQSLPGGLDTPISEGGGNFSVGQRQLLCLARAMLRRNRILVVDEATANVDPRTDAIIQEAIRNKFRDCTVLTIAHRLDTIMDCDRVMVLDDGAVREFDEPSTLLERPESLLRRLAAHTGKSYEHLRAAAADAAAARNKQRQLLEENVPYSLIE